jgi:hypothetical protein
VSDQCHLTVGIGFRRNARNEVVRMKGVRRVDKSVYWSTGSFQVHSLHLQSASLRSILILSSQVHLRLPIRLFSLGLPTRNLCAFVISPMTATCGAHSILLGHHHILFSECTSYVAPHYSFSPAFYYFLSVRPKLSPQHNILKHLESHVLHLT